jgi:flagellar basal-body rod protein FlgB
MNDITDDAIIRVLGRQMNRAVAKQVVTSGNLANLDTPGYRAREAVFDDVLAGAMDEAGAKAGADGTRVREVEGLQSRRDGNNVQLDRELLNMTRAAGDFTQAQTVLSAKFRLIRYAISETR